MCGLRVIILTSIRIHTNVPVLNWQYFIAWRHKRIVRRQSSSSMSELEAELADMELSSGNCEQTEPTTDKEIKHPSRQYRSMSCL